MTTVCPVPNSLRFVTDVDHRRAASNDNSTSDCKLDQYYTLEEYAAHCLGVVGSLFDLTAHLLVEPSAGTGSFYKLMQVGSQAYDKDPRLPGIRTANFSDIVIQARKPVGIIGNPPFGRACNLAVPFFNHAAWQASFIAFIVPRTFQKVWAQNKLDLNFHLIHEELVPKNAFLFQGRPFNVPAVFQVWERRPIPREPHPVVRTHPHFTFVKTRKEANFAIRRVGGRAGWVHHGIKASKSSNYFIKAERAVQTMMRKLDFTNLARRVAGNPSLSKAEIVQLYCEWISFGEEAIGTNSMAARARRQTRPVRCTSTARRHPPGQA